MVVSQAVHVFVFDGLADWEIGRVTYDLRTANGIPLRTFALTMDLLFFVMNHFINIFIYKV